MHIGSFLKINRLAGGLLAGIPFITGIIHGQEPPAGIVDELVSGGHVLVNARLRFEEADQANLPSSEALTIRTRLGFQTGTARGFSALVEMEDIRLLNDQDHANLAGSNPSGAGRTNIPDPEVTELNRAWLAFTYEKSALKIGRERIKLDNDRFVGNVGWRQNEQTYDMVSLSSSVVDGLKLFYSGIWKVHRIFGGVTGSPPDWEGRNHILNASYAITESLNLTGFAYLLELENAVSGANFTGSGNTFGLLATGTYPVNDSVNLSYSLSYANQSDNDGNPDTGARSRFDLNYYAFELKAGLGTATFGGGVEILEGDGTSSFSTPLATVHAFQGWADVFLGSSVAGTGLGGGIRDYYLLAGYKIPVGNRLTINAVHHWFEAESAAAYDDDYGTELDVVGVYPINKYFTAIAKLAIFDASDDVGNPYVDVEKFWLELNFSF